MNFASLFPFIDRITDAWNATPLFSQIFYAVGGIALCVVFVQAIITLVGFGDIDADTPDGGADVPHDAGLGLISVRTLTGFFMGFGLCAGAVFDATRSFPAAVGAGFCAGAVLTFIIFKIMKMLYGLSNVGNVDPKSATGAKATVYVAIPPNNAEGGQVEVTVSGRVMTFRAISKSSEKIPSGTLVEIVEVLPSNVMVVEKK